VKAPNPDKEIFSPLATLSVIYDRILSRTIELVAFETVVPVLARVVWIK
jgi:hypothetical protein